MNLLFKYTQRQRRLQCQKECADKPHIHMYVYIVHWRERERGRGAIENRKIKRNQSQERVANFVCRIRVLPPRLYLILFCLPLPYTVLFSICIYLTRPLCSEFSSWYDVCRQLTPAYRDKKGKCLFVEHMYTYELSIVFSWPLKTFRCLFSFSLIICPQDCKFLILFHFCAIYHFYVPNRAKQSIVVFTEWQCTLRFQTKLILSKHCLI